MKIARQTKESGIRYKTKFAWYPIEIDDYVLVLFERYIQRQVISGDHKWIKDKNMIKNGLIPFDAYVKYYNPRPTVKQ